MNAAVKNDDQPFWGARSLNARYHRLSNIIRNPQLVPELFKNGMITPVTDPSLVFTQEALRCMCAAPAQYVPANEHLNSLHYAVYAPTGSLVLITRNRIEGADGTEDAYVIMFEDDQGIHGLIPMCSALRPAGYLWLAIDTLLDTLGLNDNAIGSTASGNVAIV